MVARKLRFCLAEQHAAVGPKRRRTQDRGATTGYSDGDDSAPQCVDVKLVEMIGDVTDAPPTRQQHYGLFVWPSALVLAHYVGSERQLLHGKVVMELGCGTGLPGILAALCGSPKKASAVYLTDRTDALDTKLNVEANIRLNGLEGVAEFVPLNWGDMHVPDRLLGRLETVDLVLAADCFYSSKDFEKVIATVALVFRCNPRSRFVTTYQLRSISHSIGPLLARWQMTARAIDQRSFVPRSAVQDGEGAALETVLAYEIRPVSLVHSTVQQQ